MFNIDESHFHGNFKWVGVTKVIGFFNAKRAFLLPAYTMKEMNIAYLMKLLYNLNTIGCGFSNMSDIISLGFTLKH